MTHSSDQNALNVYQAILHLERMLQSEQLLSKTDEMALAEILTRVVRKVGKQHPGLKLAAKWDLRLVAA